MLLVDANVLLYAVNRSSQEHSAARSWLDAALNGGEAVGFAWVAILAFLRLSTHAAIFARPLSNREALGVLEPWLGAAPAIVVEPTARHLALISGLLESAGSGANLVTDAHLAALALEHGATVVSFDRDFERFPGVRCLRPDSA